MANKKETTLDMIARNLASLHSDVKDGFDKVDTRFDKVESRLDRAEVKLDKIDVKLDSVSFNHGRRLDLLEDDVTQIKTALIKNRLLAKN